MKLHFLATGDAPERYSFDGDQITAEKGGVSETFDLSGLEAGGKFLGVTVESLPLAAGHVLRNAHRDSSGELHVTLCQAVGGGDWTEQDGEIDASEYDPATPYVRLLNDGYEPKWSDERGEWVAVKKETT